MTYIFESLLLLPVHAIFDDYFWMIHGNYLRLCFLSITIITTAVIIIIIISNIPPIAPAITGRAFEPVAVAVAVAVAVVTVLVMVVVVDVWVNIIIETDTSNECNEVVYDATVGKVVYDKKISVLDTVYNCIKQWDI